MLFEHLLGLYEKAQDPALSWEQMLLNAKHLGFDYVEISIDETDERLARLEWTADEIEQLRRTCFQTGINIQSMCLSAHRRFPFGSADPEIRRRAYTIMQSAIDFASAMGIRVIQLAGYDVYYEPSDAKSVALFREGMCWAAQRAAQKQVMLAMEIMDTEFMSSITKHMVYEKLIHSPWYKVYPDVGNLSAWPENDVEKELRLGADSIVAIHLKDTLAVSESCPGKFKCVPFGSGCVDFTACFRQLEQLHYHGPFTIEMWYDPCADSIEEIRKAKAWLEKKYCEIAEVSEC